MHLIGKVNVHPSLIGSALGGAMPRVRSSCLVFNLTHDSFLEILLCHLGNVGLEEGDLIDASLWSLSGSALPAPPLEPKLTQSDGSLRQANKRMEGGDEVDKGQCFFPGFPILKI